MKGERPAVWLVASREPATNHRSIRLPRRAELPPLLNRVRVRVRVRARARDRVKG